MNVAARGAALCFFGNGPQLCAPILFARDGRPISLVRNLHFNPNLRFPLKSRGHTNRDPVVRDYDLAGAAASKPEKRSITKRAGTDGANSIAGAQSNAYSQQWWRLASELVACQR
jgi:hypothetical protein